MDLCRLVPDMDVRTLSIAMKRDSKHSTYAHKIAEAMGINLKWLLTGEGEKDTFPATARTRSLPQNGTDAEAVAVAFTADERILLEGYRRSGPERREDMLTMARKALDTFTERSGTQ